MRNNQKEFLKCKRDPIYFIETYLRIFNPSQGNIPFNLYKKQKEFLHLFLTKHEIISFKSRQTGMSTLLQQLSLWLQLFYDNYNIGIISLEQQKQNDFLKGQKIIYYNSDLSWLNVKIVKNIESLFSFTNNSSIRQGNSNNPFRSYTMSTIIVDEQQFIPNLKTQLMSVAPTLQRISNTSLPYGIILNSTQNGIDNYYYQVYQKQLHNEGGYTLFKFHWSDIPEYDEEWYERQCDLLDNDPKLIQQELDMKFIGSGDTYIKGEVLEQIQSQISNEYDVIYLDDEQRYKIQVYDHPEENEEYIIGVDPSGGTGNDYSQVIVLRRSDQNVVQIFENNEIDDRQLSILLNKLGTYYNNQKIGIEQNGGFGLSVIRRLKNELNYSNLFWSEPLSNNQIKKGSKRKKKEKVQGIINNMVTRPLILSNMQKYIYNDYTIVRQEQLFNELLVLIHYHGKVQQRYGFHDDLVFQFQHQLWVRENEENDTNNNVFNKEDENNQNVLSKIVFVERQTLKKDNDNSYIDNSNTVDNQQNEMMKMIKNIDFKR